jgi:prophage regulatory protein
MTWTNKIEILALLTKPSVTKQEHSIVATPVRFIRIEEVMEITSCCRSTIFQLQKAGKFPACVLIAKRGARFVESEILQWCVDRMAERSTVGEL